MCELWAAERRVVVGGRGSEHSNGEETGTGKPCEYIPSSVSLRLRLHFDQNGDPQWD